MNQERIKDRILRRAARMWGYNEIEAETSFDPVVGLLLSACAAELEKLDFELENSRARIIERVLEVMFPEEVSGVAPARTLIQVYPLENNVKISNYQSFKMSVRKQNMYNPAENTVKDLYFSPSVEVRLTTAILKYFAYNETLHRIENFFFDDIVGKANKPLPSGEFWLGMQSPQQENLEDLMFFVDINNTYQKEVFFYYLNQVKVYCGQKEFKLNPGYNEESGELNIDNIITKNYSDLDYIRNETNQYFRSHFFTLKGKIDFENKHRSELFENYYPNHRVAEEENVIWLKFCFSEAVVPDILQNVRFALNCIPVLNIKNTIMGRKITGKLNIIPINENEKDYFLDLDCVTEENGRRLDLKDYDDRNEGMTALLRNGGVSRFDRRNASELLQYLLELIKDETAAFAGMGTNTAIEILRQINQNVASLHQIARERNFVQTNNPYLVISSGNTEADMRCVISYWSTAAEEGNNLKPGSVLIAENSGKSILKESATMIRASVGGRKKLSPNDKILEYRNSLLTRGRIVTAADIRAFAMNHFKNLITDVKVQKGTKKEVSLKGGFSRTVDVFLIRNEKTTNEIQKPEWSYLCDSFLLKLQTASANVYPYRLFEK